MTTTVGMSTATTEGRPSSRPSPWAARARWTIVVVVAVAVAVGMAMRIWYLLHDPIDSDQALIGILAREILAGHLHAFLLGQPYGGAEPYLVAAVFGLFGSSPLTLGIPAVLCNAIACVLVWRIALELSQRGDIAAICAAVMWVAPQSEVWNSTLEYGFRGVTILCGTAMLLLALRLYRGADRWWDAPLLGAAVGVGWWSSPEILYFAVPSGIWAAGWLWRTRHDFATDARRVAAVLLGLLAAVAGALPWLWDNVTSGFPSMAVSKYDAPGVVPTYGARLDDFFHGDLPMVLDLVVPRSGRWDVPPALGVAMLVVVGAAVAASLAWLLWRRGVGAALAVGVLAYPFILSLAPASVAWKAGRYTNFLVPLLVLLVAAMFGDRSSRRANVANDRRERRVRPRTLFLLSALTACLVAASVVAFEDLRTINVLPGSRAGPTANQPAEALASALGGVGIRGGYADYWVAYKLDFLAPGRLELTDTPPSPDRLPSVRTAVRALPARRQAWIFVKPTPTARTEYADTSIIRGPSGLQLTSFLSDLDRLGIAHRVLHLSGADAVVCVRPVTPAEVGLRFAAVGS